MKRKNPIRINTTHHVYSKSISHFQIFNTPLEYERILKLVRYYRFEGMTVPFSQFIKKYQHCESDGKFEDALARAAMRRELRVHIIAYCFMPTHVHFVLHGLVENGIERFMRDICNGYSHYFNLQHNRKGPLWQNRFGNDRIGTKVELMAVVRYVHLNPTTAFLTDHPGDWAYSSFGEYVGRSRVASVCDPDDVCQAMGEGGALEYENFVVDYVGAQRELKRNKKRWL